MPLSPAERQARARKKRLKAGLSRLDIAIAATTKKRLIKKAKAQGISLNTYVLRLLLRETAE